MKIIDESIQIVDGCITCPHCSGDLIFSSVVGMHGSIATPAFKCADCKKTLGLQISGGCESHTHVNWVEVPADVIDKAEALTKKLLEKSTPDTETLH